MVSLIPQFSALLVRSWKGLIRDPVLVRARIFQTIVLKIYNQFVGILFGLIYLRLENNISNVMNFQGAIFSIISNITFEGAYGVINVK